MKIPSDNPNITPTTTSGVPEQVPYPTGGTKKKSGVAGTSYQDELTSVYQDLGFGSSESQSGPVSTLQTPSLEEPSVVMNPAMVMTLLTGLTNQQSSEDMKSSVGLMRTNMSNEHVGILTQLANDKKIMADAAKAAHVSFWDKLFGWLGVAILDVVAVVATVATGGGATGLLVAATVATSMMVLQQSGALGDLTKLIAQSLEKDGMSSKEAQIMAEVFVMAAVVTAVIVSTVASGGLGAANVVSDTSEGGEMLEEGTEMQNFAEDNQEVEQMQEQASDAQQMKANVSRLATLGKVTNAILKLSSAGLQTTGSVFTADRLEDKAANLDVEAWITRNEKAVSTLQNQVKSMVQLIKQNTEIATQAISAYALTQEKVAQYSQV